MPTEPGSGPALPPGAGTGTGNTPQGNNAQTMPPRDGVVAGSVKYPNLGGLINATYTVSHGITPGNVVVRTQIGQRDLLGRGKVTITDGQRSFDLEDCRVDEMTVERSGGSGQEIVAKLSDERWRWEYTAIDGWYNQLDDNGKLLPSTVRSPTELAKLCLEKLLVEKYTIDMPPGITSEDAAAMPDLLVSGINFPAIGINPPCDWYGDNAATVLAQLCDACGRRLVYDPIERAVHIVRAGIGAALPPGSLSMQQLTLTSPDTPDAVMVLGSPTRYQGLFPLQAVGEDWDGQIKPINALSYAPLGEPTKHAVTVTCTSVAEKLDPVTGLPDGKPLLRIEIMEPNQSPTAQAGSVVALQFEYQVLDTDTVDTVAAALAALVSAAAVPAGLGPFTVVVTGARFTVTHSVVDRPFEITVSGDGYKWLSAEVAQAASVNKVDWRWTAPPLFMGVRATDQLTMEQARALAQKTVYKMYRLAGTDVATGKAPMFVPGYGEVKKRQYILLEGTQVEQAVPEAGDAKFVDINEEPLIQNLYNGYSRDKRGAVYGSVAVELFDSSYVGDGGLDNPSTADNTGVEELVPIPFSVDAKNQSIVFSNYVYKIVQEGCIAEADTLVLKTACTVRDHETQQVRGYTDKRVIREGKNIMVIRRPDVQLNVYGVYVSNGTGRWKISSVETLESDPIVRARYYLDAAMIQLQLKPGLVQKYNGIMPIRMDGRIMQVTYEIRGGSGCETTVSLNAEHDVFSLPYPARRRAENLAFVDRVIPPGSRNNPKLNGPEMYRATKG